MEVGRWKEWEEGERKTGDKQQRRNGKGEILERKIKTKVKGEEVRERERRCLAYLVHSLVLVLLVVCRSAEVGHVLEEIYT